MASFIDKIFYNDEYKGKPIPGSDFDRVAMRASETIDGLVHGRISRKGLANFSADTQNRIKMATCAIAEGRYQYESMTADTGGAIKTSESVTGYSYSIDAKSVSKVEEEAYDRAMSYLFPTGLLYGGICGC